MRSNILTAAVSVLFLGSPLLQGQDTLHIGFGAGTACAMGCAGDPNTSGTGGSSVIDIFQNQGGGSGINGLQLLLAIPNDTTNLGLTVTGETDINPYPGGTSTPGSASLITFKSGFTSGNVYSFVGLSGSASDSFGNLQASEPSTVTATSFGVYEFSINTVLGPKGLANISFSSPLPLGTYAFGYLPGGYSTPFTESGLIDGTPVSSTPEPGAIVLLSTCLACLVFSQRRRIRTHF